MKLVASLATRGRAQRLVATLTQHMKCLSRPDTKMIVQCDADDWQTMAALQAAPLDPRVTVNVKPRPDTVAAKWNAGLSEPGDVYLCSADDDPYLTPDLDEKVLQAASVFPDGFGVVYGHLNYNLSFPGVIAYTAKWAERLGHLQPEYFPYWFADHWTDDIARITERFVFCDVRNSRSDQFTQNMREPAWWATWFDAAYLMRREIAHKLIDDPAFDAPDWLKRRLKTNYIGIEDRSRIINDGVRAQSKQFEAMSGLPVNDPQYQRAKQAAAAMLPHLLDDYGMDKVEAMRFREALDPPNTIAALPRAYA